MSFISIFSALISHYAGTFFYSFLNYKWLLFLLIDFEMLWKIFDLILQFYMGNEFIVIQRMSLNVSRRSFINVFINDV